MAKSADEPGSRPLSLLGGPDRRPDEGRRRALGRIGAAPALAVGAGLGLGTAEARALETAQWMKEPGRPFLSPPYGQPSPFEKEVVRVLPAKPAAFPTATLHWFGRSGHFPAWDQPDETVRTILESTDD